MAIYPKARVRLLPESATQPRITPTQVICHTAVDGANTTSLYPYFSTSSNLESHFYVAGDGTVEQYMDTEVRADANYKANSRAISIETHDGWASTGNSGAVTTPWTAAQVGALTELIGWLCDTHGIPKGICPGWDQPGIGWHNLFPLWSYPGPTGCPGPTRTEQLRDVVIPLIGASRPAAVPDTPTPQLSEEDDDMKVRFYRGQNDPTVMLASSGLTSVVKIRNPRHLHDTVTLLTENGAEIDATDTTNVDVLDEDNGKVITVPIRIVGDAQAADMLAGAR